MQLLLILAVVAAITITKNAPSRPLDDGAAPLAISIGGMAGVALFAALASGWAARGLRREGLSRQWIARFERLQLLHTGIWLVVTLGILHIAGWTRLVRFNWHTEGLWLVDDLLIFLPIVLPMLLSWIAFYGVDRLVQRQMSQRNAAPTTPVSLRQYLGFHIRHHLGLVLLPVLALLAIEDAARLFAPEVAEGEGGWWVCLPAVGAMFVLLPLMLRRLWKTTSLPPSPLRDRLEKSARRWGVGTRDILIWHTDQRVVNAAITGFVGPLRYVFLTDGLLARFSDQQIEAVFAHELGHVIHRHLPLRLLAIIAPSALVYALVAASPESAGTLQQWLSGYGLSPGLQTEVLGPLALLVAVAGVFGVYSQFLERQADWFAVQATGSCDECEATQDRGDLQPAGQRTQPFIDSLERLARVGGVGRRRRSWLHPSIARRVEFLHRLEASPDEAQRFTAHMRLAAWLLAGILACAVIVSAWPFPA